MAENKQTNVEWTVGTEVVALYEFDGNDPEDLAFNCGDILTITSTTDDHNWYQGRRSDGKVGMIPRSFVKERGEDTEEVSIAPQLPARGEARKVDLREQDETPSAKLTNREKCALYENIKFLYPTDNHRLGWPPGTEVVAKFAFAGYDPEDLPFNKRDVLTIVKPTRDPAWYLGRSSDGGFGMIPANYVVLERGEVKANLDLIAENNQNNVDWPVGTEIVALRTFDSNDPEDLPFISGDILTITSTTEDHNWYQGRRSDGKFGRIPSGHVKERGEATLEGSIAPQAPRKGDTRRMDVPDQGEPPTPKSPKRAECALYENTKFLYPTSEWPPGTEVVAQFTFAGYDPEDLPFNKWDVLTIVKSTRYPAWYLGRRSDGEVGLIPASFVAIERREVKALPMPWFHGHLRREQADELLQPHENGMFLVRESSNFPGDYTLCLCSVGDIKHYRIMCRGNILTIDDEHIFENLHQLVEHYKRNVEGLHTRLTKPVINLGKLHYFVNKQAFVNQDWVIKKEDLKLGEITFKGQNISIIKGEYKGQKIVVRSLEHSLKTEQQFLIKAAIMTTLRHPNVVQLIGVVLCKPIYIVTESIGKGSLLDYLRSKGTAIQKRKQINFATDICNGMAHLEKKRIVHRELCAAKMMVSEDGSAKVAGLGKVRYADSGHTGGKIRIKWTAPEALGPDPIHTNKSDMWSFGILLWEIYSYGLEPYPEMGLADVVHHVASGSTMTFPADCPVGVCEVMHHAWQFHPVSRPCFSDVKLQLTNIQTTTK